MKRRVLKIVAIASGGMLGVTVLLFIAGYVLNPSDHHISLGDSFHVGVSSRGLDSRIVVFNDADYGAYEGSVIDLVDRDGRGDPTLKRKIGWGDSWGVYYRYFQWSDGTLWTLMISLWYPIALLAIMPAVWFACEFSRSRRAFREPAHAAACCPHRSTGRMKTTMKVEDQYTDVLQNMELGIVLTYRKCPNLSDYDVMRGLEALIDAYRAENIGRPPRPFNLSDDERLLVENVRRMCEWRLGRGNLGEDPAEEKGITPAPNTIDEVVLCLKRIVKSVKTWNASGGRQGYLNFIVQYVK